MTVYYSKRDRDAALAREREAAARVAVPPMTPAQLAAHLAALAPERVLTAAEKARAKVEAEMAECDAEAEAAHWKHQALSQDAAKAFEDRGTVAFDPDAIARWAAISHAAVDARAANEVARYRHRLAAEQLQMVPA